MHSADETDKRPDYADDPSILDSESLLRRIHPTQYVPVEESGEWIVSSAAFNDHIDSPMSTARENRVENFEAYLKAFPSHGLAKLSVASMRQLKQRVTQIPRIDGEPEHTWVAGDKSKPKVRRAIRDAALLVVKPLPPNSPLG